LIERVAIKNHGLKKLVANMIIKKNPNKKFKIILHEFSSSKKIIFISVILIFCSILLVAIGDRYGGSIKALETKTSFRDLISFIKSPSYKAFSKSPKETVSFDIKFLDLQELNNRRKLALDNYSLKFIENDYIDVDMIFKGEKFPVKIKLKGATAHEHQLPKKWSFKVQLKGGTRFMGMQSFSLMDPKRRNNMYEWLYRLATKEEGIITKKYDFINVTINGTDMGLYAFDEEFDKTMLENNQRRDGSIISLKDDSFWLDSVAFEGLTPSLWGEYYLSAPMEIKNSKDNFISKHSQEAIDLLSGFRRGELSVSEVFDVKKLAKTMAIGDFFLSDHGFMPFNSVFYYNPIIHRLEPIPDDTFSEERHDPQTGVYRYNAYWVTGIYLAQIINDFDFAEVYLRELNRVIKKSYIDNLLLKYSKEVSENYEAFIADFIPEKRVKINKEIYYSNIKAMSKILNPNVAIIANFEKIDSDGLRLSIASTTSLPVELISLTIDDQITLLPCTLDEKNCVNKIKGKGPNVALNYSKYKFFYPELFDISMYPDLSKSTGLIKVKYRILGSDIIRADSIFAYKAYDSEKIILNSKLMKPNYKEFDFLDYDDDRKTIRIKQGLWKLEKDLIIPKNYTFSGGPNTTIDFINSAKILSYSPVIFEGTKESPINFISSNASSGSITIFANGRSSKLVNVVIDGLVNTSDSTGAVTFFESPVVIKGTAFKNINSEDALNIIKSSFSISDSIFSGNHSDSLDIDFGKGDVINSRFINSGNDSIDISGSDIKISFVNIYNSGDKGISVGEKSTARINHSEIRLSKIGVASKDSSSTKITRSTIKDCNYGIALYQKKPDFGPASTILHTSKLRGNDHDFIVEENSTLIFNQIKYSEKFEKVYERLYEN